MFVWHPNILMYFYFETFTQKIKIFAFFLVKIFCFLMVCFLFVLEILTFSDILIKICGIPEKKYS